MGVSHLPILIILVVVALIVFGPKRLPELGHGLGKAITEFKKGVTDLTGSPQPASTAAVATVGTHHATPVDAAEGPTAAAPLQGAPGHVYTAPPASAPEL